MARTLNGNLTGLAARTDLADRRQAILDDAPNGYDWRCRLAEAWAELHRYPVLCDIWDSGIIPEQATYREHAQLAEMLLQYRDVVPEFSQLPSHS